MIHPPGLPVSLLKKIPEEFLPEYLIGQLLKFIDSFPLSSSRELAALISQPWQAIYASFVFELEFRQGGFEKVLDSQPIPLNILLSAYKTMGLPQISQIIEEAIPDTNGLSINEHSHRLNHHQARNKFSPTNLFIDYNQRLVDQGQVVREHRLEYVVNNLDKFALPTTNQERLYTDLDFAETWELTELNDIFDPADNKSADEYYDDVLLRTEKIVQDYLRQGQKVRAEISYHLIIPGLAPAIKLGQEKALETILKYSQLLKELDRETEANVLKAAVHFSRGHLLYHKRDYKAAIGKFQLALDCFPAAVSNWHLAQFEGFIGQAHHLAGQQEVAIEAINRSLALHQDAHWLEVRANAYLYEGLLEEALSDFKLAVQLEPGRANLFHRQGFIYLQLGEFAQAAEAFGMVRLLNPDLMEPWELFELYETFGFTDGAKQEVELALINNPDSKAYVKKALLNRAENDQVQAFENLSMALELDPNNAEACSEFADFYLELGEKDKSEQYHEKAIELEPLNPDWKANKTILLSQTGRYQEAIALIDEAITLMAKSRPVAHTDFSPDNEDEIDPFRDCYKSRVPNSYEEADTTGLYSIRAVCNLELYNLDQALDDAEKANSFELIRSIVPLGVMARVCIERKDLTTAMSYIDQALALERNDWILAIRGLIHLELGLVKDAIQDCTEAIQSDPKEGRPFLVRAVAYGKIGDEQQAQRDFEMAKKLGYKPNPKEELSRLITECSSLNSTK